VSTILPLLSLSNDAPDESFIDSMPVVSVDLEKAERKKLLSLINTYSSFTPADMDWVLPLKKQLELAD
jgi:hypothetical protein